MKSSMFIVLLVSIVICSSCATNSKNLKLSTIKPEQGAFYGRVKIFIDNEDVTGNCYIGSKDLNDERVYFNLDQDGLFSGISKRGENWISELRCRKGMSNYSFLWKNKELTFQNAGNKKKTYFGDVTINWDSKNDNTNYALFLLGGLGGGIAANQSQDLTKLKFQIVDRGDETTKLFHDLYKEQDQLKFLTNLLTEIAKSN